MAERKGSHEPSLWERLPKNEQERQKAIMAAGRIQPPANGAKRGNGTFALKGYVRCELSASDKDAYRTWEAAHSHVECLEQVVKLADSGYLFKLGEQGGGFQASLSAYTTGQSWDGYVMVAHAGSATRAVMLLVYKHQILMLGEWTAFVSDGGEDDFR